MGDFRNGIKIHKLGRKKIHKEYEDNKINEIEGDVSVNVKQNISLIKQITGNSGDIVFREFMIGENHQAALVYVDGLTDKKTINDFILKSLMFETRESQVDQMITEDNLLNIIKDYDLTINEIGHTDKLRKVIHAIFSGDTVIFAENHVKAFIANTRGWDMRAIEEPRTEAVIRGPREGFIETLRVNTALIRRKLKDPDLRIIHYEIGERTKTDMSLIYIEGIMDEPTLIEIKKRIGKIETDAILESGYIEQMIEDSSRSPFPQIQYTERPDKAVAHLLEGKAIIVVDGTPFVLIVPAVFTQFYHSPEDYYERFWIGTFLRLIRLISLSIALLAPALYIAFSSFHPEMIPSKLLIAMAAGRSTVPFPSIIEAMVMEITIEILREASVRLPGIIGPTIGIVGALVIGQAAVQAGLVSPLMVIVVSITTIGSFATPSYNAAISVRLLRFPIMIMSSLFGLYGIMLALLLITLHLASLKSFGVPYLSPLSPLHFKDMKDMVFRAPLTWMIKRPIFFKPSDKKREDIGVKSGDEKGTGPSKSGKRK